jgi:tripartite-type tricarboxylate transporter receptor subunit TctC
VKGRILSLVLAMLVGLAPLAAHAQQSSSYPTRLIKIIANTPPGSPPDLLSRVVGEKLRSVFGQAVVVENRPGASGTIGLRAVAKSPPDGYTLGTLTLPAIASPSLIAKMPYDTEKDLAPVGLMVWEYHLLAVPGGSPAKSVADLVAAAKAKPGVLKFASGGNGTPAHLAGELFKREAGVDIVHIPYKGAPAGAVALLTGEVDMMIGAIPALSPHNRSGKVRALATSALRRIPAYPELPTLVELGYSGIGNLGWLGLVAPTGTPRAVIARLHVEIEKALALSEVKERLESFGWEPAKLGPEEFGVHIRSELQRWGKVIRDAGIKPD